MTACTERHDAACDDGLAGEGQKGMPKGGLGVTACDGGLAREVRKGVPEEGSA